MSSNIAVVMLNLMIVMLKLDQNSICCTVLQEAISDKDHFKITRKGTIAHVLANAGGSRISGKGAHMYKGVIVTSCFVNNC